MSWPSVPLMKQMSLLAATTPSSPPAGFAGVAETACDMDQAPSAICLQKRESHAGNSAPAQGKSQENRSRRGSFQTPSRTIAGWENGVNLWGRHEGIKAHRHEGTVAETGML